jgi:hypothetical protein
MHAQLLSIRRRRHACAATYVEDVRHARLDEETGLWERI